MIICSLRITIAIALLFANTGVLCHFWELHTPTAYRKAFTIPYSNTITNRASVSSDEVFSS